VFVETFGAEPDEEFAHQLDHNREMTTRIGWKPYMYSHALIHQLPGVRLPTLVISGGEDRIVPASVAEDFSTSLPNSERLHFDLLGHQADLEAPALLAESISKYLSTSVTDGK
jgi:pimeloyl-ACP methyl ester carboxylesterase